MTRLVTRVALWTALLLIVAITAAPEKAQYKLERSVDGITWETRATFVITRVDPSSPPRIKVLATEDDQFTETIKPVSPITSATPLYYHVRDHNGEVAAAASSTVCALVRGFEPVSSKALKLKEHIGIAVSEGTDVAGLQLSFPTNLHHTSLGASDCDTSVLKLFPEITSDIFVTLVKPTGPKLVTRFEDGPVAGGIPAAASSDKAAKGKSDPKASADGKETPQEDNRSFLEKYWLYIVMFVVWTLINGFLQQKTEASAAAKKK